MRETSTQFRNAHRIRDNENTSHFGDLMTSLMHMWSHFMEDKNEKKNIHFECRKVDARVWSILMIIGDDNNNNKNKMVLFDGENLENKTKRLASSFNKKKTTNYVMYRKNQ